MYRSEYLYRNIDKLIQDSEVFPICVPSYNRPNASLLKYSKAIPLWLFVREEQMEMYKEYQGICKIIPCSPTADMLQERIDNLQEAIDTLESIDIDDLKSQSVESVMSELDDYDFEKTYDFDEECEKGQENGIADDLTNDLNEKIADEIESALSSVEV